MLEGSSGPAKRVESRRGVVIRFAGDSGDGMQVTGIAVHDRVGAGRQRPRNAARLPRRDPRAGRARWPASARSSSTSPADDVFTPGDDLDVLVAMNPAALRMNLDDLRPGGILIVDREAFNDANLRKAGYDAEPARRRLARALAALPGRHHEAHHRVAEGPGPVGARGVPLPQLLLPRHRLVAVPPPDRADRAVGRGASSRRTPSWSRPTAARCGPAGTSPRTPSCSAVSYEVPPATIPPGTYRNITGNTATALGLVAAAQQGRPAALPRQLSDHAGQRRPARAGGAQEVRRLHLPGRGRDRRHRRGAGRGVRRRHRRHDHQRPRHVPEGRDARPGAGASSCRSIVVDIQRGGPSTGMPTKTEQADLLMALYGRTRRGAGADPGALHAGGLLRRRRSRRCASRSAT